MPVFVSLVGTALVALMVALVASYLGRHQTAIGDPEPMNRWLVERIARHRGARRIVGALDRWVWGGAMVGLAVVAVLGAAAAIGWLLISIDTSSGFARFDQAVAEWGSTEATDWSTDILGGVTLLGSTMVLIVVMAVVAAIDVFRGDERNWSVPGFLLTVVIGISVVNNALKWLVDRERPEVEHLAGSGGAAFPSGHTAAAAACWAAIALVSSRHLRLRRRRWAASLAVSVAVMVAASRVLLGVHWLTDVLAGLVVGWTWCFLVALVFGGRLQRFGIPADQVDARSPEPVGARSQD